MSKEQILSVVRTILKGVGTVLVTRGYTNDGGLELLVGGLVAAVGVVWSVVAHKKTATE